MLKIIRSGFSSFGREHILSSVKALVEEGRRSYLIVPEQQTVMAEGEMSKKLPPSAPLSFEVTNFTRLANTTFRSLGGISGEYCDNGKKALVMWRALTELSPVLTMTAGRKEISAGLVERALGAVSEMESLGIGPEQLLSGGEAPLVMEDKRLSGKLSDLSKIYTLYKTLLKEKYADTGEDCEAMVRKLSENPRFLADAEIFIDGFTSFTQPQYRLIELLVRRCAVTVSLAISAMGGSAFEYTEVRAAEERLIFSARAAGVDIKLIAPKGMEERDFSFSRFAEYIWQNDEALDNKTLQNATKMRILEARTPFEECEFIAADIKRKVMEGDSFCDFAIVARGADKYAGILDTALSMGGIPAFTAFGRDISSFEIITWG